MVCGENREQGHADEQELVVDGHVAVEPDVVDVSCLDPGQRPGRVATDSLLGELDELDMLAVVEQDNLAAEDTGGRPGCMFGEIACEVVVGQAAEALEEHAELAKDIEQDHHGLKQQENADEVACSYQEAEGGLDEAKTEQDCDEDFAEHWDEQIEAGSHSAVRLETHGNQQLTADLGAEERVETAACAVLEPSRKGVAEKWSTACEVLRVEHTATAKKMEEAEA